MASLALLPLPSTGSSRDSPESEENHSSQDRNGVSVAPSKVSPTACCPSLLACTTPATEDSLRALSLPHLREAEGLFSSLFRQQVSRSPAWIASELVLLRRLLYKFKRQHRRAEFFQKAQSVSRVAQPLVSLLSLFSPEGLRAPCLRTDELVSSWLSRVYASSARRGRAGDAQQNTSRSDGQEAEAKVSAAQASARATGREGGRSGRSRHGVAKTFLSFFLEALLARALHLQDATVHASSSAIQQVHLGYHLNLVLPLLAIYSRVLALVSALVGAAEHQVQQMPVLLDFMGNGPEGAEGREELRAKTDAKLQHSTQRAACLWDAPAPAPSGVRTPDARSREVTEMASHRKTTSDGEEEGRECMQEEAVQEARRAGDGGEDEKDVTGSDARPVGEEGRAEAETAAASREAEPVTKKQKTGEWGRVLRCSSDAKTGALSAHDRSSHSSVPQACDDMLAFLLSEKKNPSTFGSLAEKKSASSAKKRRTASGESRPVHSENSTAAVLAAAKRVKKKRQFESSHPPMRERSESEGGVSTDDHDALLAFLLSEKPPKRPRPVREKPKTVATKKSKEKRKVPPSEAQANCTRLRVEFPKTGGLEGLTLSSRAAKPASSCVSNEGKSGSARVAAADEGLCSHLAYRPEKAMKATASELGRQTDVPPSATPHKGNPKATSAFRSGLAQCTSKEFCHTCQIGDDKSCRNVPPTTAGVPRVLGSIQNARPSLCACRVQGGKAAAL
ncbi:hypothetical protein TGMAS_288370, partial [Toxoplasma gondii MAS]